jgi:prevent-host-death family protein
MAKYTVREAKTNFSKLLLKAVAGEDVIITRRDKPVARVVPVEGKKRNWGFLKSEVRVAKDFDEVPDGFEGLVKSPSSD